MIKPTYCVRKVKHRRIPWEYLKKYGETIMIIFDSRENLRRCKNQARCFRQRSRMDLRLICQTSTYLVYELKASAL